MGRFVPNPGFEARASRDPAMKAMLRARAGRAAKEVERIGQQVASSYQATVEETAEGVRIEASTDGINAASWIEFGNENMPAHAPLRRAAEANGGSVKGGRR